MGIARNKTCNVGHIHHQHSADLMGNVCKDLKIDGSGVCRCTGNDQLGLMLFRHIADVVVIDQAGSMVHIIGYHIVILTGNIGRTAMGQVSAVGKAHTHQRITGLQQRQLNSHIGLCTGVGLHIGKFCTKQLLGALDTQAFQFIHEVAAAIVALAGQALSIFIGQNGTHSGDHRRGCKVLGSNQLDAILLTVQFPPHHCSDLRVEIGNESDGIQKFCTHSLFLLSK